MLKSPGAVAFHIGTLNIYWYGIIIAVSFLAGLFIVLKTAIKDYPDDLNIKEQIIDLSTLLLFGGIVSARIYYVIFNWNYYSSRIPEIFMTWQGGLSIHGAIIGSILIIYYYTKKNNLSLLKFTDLFAYGMIFAQSIGRWGNFFNSEAFGSPTNLPWKVYIPPSSRPEEYINYEFFHPAFLYESIWNMLVFIVLFVFIRKFFKEKTGTVTFSYFILYSLGRFFIEGMRIDNIYSIWGIHIAQFISIIMFIIATIGLYRTINHK